MIDAVLVRTGVQQTSMHPVPAPQVVRLWLLIIV
jgi:hypothetical protein